ncbi:nuclear transcription factor Y subunit C-1 [Dorcoceras hygrometricum]|uniref:Nuclear transcription factor Y subunit C-1 n=1 Tax=Dorcoceras hygrometricum TaxID=472368 RepID=A0A2Z7AJ67_9LAMI|nr:nuclear transcription factor Y subunit C-1 [Dorcoceras hygrometricum]
MGGDHLRDQLAQVGRRRVCAQPCATCAHGYRSVGATPTGLCAQGMHDRRVTVAAWCAWDASVYPVIPAAICARLALRARDGMRRHARRRVMVARRRAKTNESVTDGISSPRWSKQIPSAASSDGVDGEGRRGREKEFAEQLLSLFKKKKKRRWSWNEEVQQEATVGYQQMRRGARYGMSCDDISLDVITISSWLSADEAKRERRSDVVLRFSRWINVDDVIGDVIQSQESADSAGRLCVVISAVEATVSSRNAKISSRKMNSRRKQQQHPVESLYESAVANQPVASFAYSVDLVPRRKELKKKQSAAVVGINQQRSS